MKKPLHCYSAKESKWNPAFKKKNNNNNDDDNNSKNNSTFLLGPL